MVEMTIIILIKLLLLWRKERYVQKEKDKQKMNSITQRNYGEKKYLIRILFFNKKYKIVKVLEWLKSCNIAWILAFPWNKAHLGQTILVNVSIQFNSLICQVYMYRIFGVNIVSFICVTISWFVFVWFYRSYGRHTIFTVLTLNFKITSMKIISNGFSFVLADWVKQLHQTSIFS